MSNVFGSDLLQEINGLQAESLRLDAERLDAMPGDVQKLKARLFRIKAELLEEESSRAFPLPSQSEGPRRSLTELVQVASHVAA